MNSLIDTGARAYLLIDLEKAIDLAEQFKIRVIPLPRPQRTKDFEGKEGSPITHAIILDLWIDGRQFVNMPFLITRLGQHDTIIGRTWLNEQDIWLDCRHQQLIWPDTRAGNSKVPKKEKEKESRYRPPRTELSGSGTGELRNEI